MTDLPLTLLQMQGAPLDPPRLDEACLVLIDLQEEYRTGGLPLDRIEAAAAEAARVLQMARAADAPIVHVLHEVGPGAPVFDPATRKFQPIEGLEAHDGEPTI
ncbi:MAG: isochorismatase family protein, partial [Methylobacteriaceae bacterium]|nr:isochorismatase family protein [Methylobacteriaceae bacterium]